MRFIFIRGANFTIANPVFPGKFLAVSRKPAKFGLVTTLPSAHCTLMLERLAYFLSLLLIFAPGAIARQAPRGSITSDIRLWNDQWLFDRADAPASASDSDFQPVTLPHTARLEEPWLPGWTPFQGVCTYRKHFDASPFRWGHAGGGGFDEWPVAHRP
jgi:hypothetical protein